MTSWFCGIAECGRRFDGAAGVIRHQATEHSNCECAVCGRALPSGYLAIRHAFQEHTRAEYLRAYDADSDDIRIRERLLDDIEGRVDVATIVDGIQGDGDSAVSVGD